ncbi:MAG TPA: RNA-binding protein [Thermohalobaculum sp.]|nr:RNA-binding protein [Thermohalobaculum sp.]
MTRGGARKLREEPERRCIASGETGPIERMIRFVLDPGGALVPDLAAKLPGRGVWLTADRALVEKAVKKRLFARGFRTAVQVPDDLAERLEGLLAARLVETIGLARKAGQAVTGFEKVRARVRGGAAGALVQASDGAQDGKAKLARLAGSLPRVEVLTAQELGLAFGRDFAIHAALDRGGFADRAVLDANRLGGLRRAGPATDEAPAGDARQEGPETVPGQGDG